MSAPKGQVPWNAGTSEGWSDKKGYRWVYDTVDGKRKARREHRVVMERKLGRKLEPEEVVHHINGDKADNRPENLFVIGHGAHTEHHHYGRQNTEASKESMATIARQREQINRLRSINADLLAFAEKVYADDTADDGRSFEEVWGDTVVAAHEVIAKAKGSS